MVESITVIAIFGFLTVLFVTLEIAFIIGGLYLIYLGIKNLIKYNKEG